MEMQQWRSLVFHIVQHKDGTCLTMVSPKTCCAKAHPCDGENQYTFVEILVLSTGQVNKNKQQSITFSKY